MHHEFTIGGCPQIQFDAVAPALATEGGRHPEPGQ
jgi:hypothetical protein